MNEIKVGLCQYTPVWEDKEANKAAIQQLLANDSRRYDLLVFPEMTLTGFSMHAERLAEGAQSDTVVFFSSLARTFCCGVLFGIIASEKQRYYNELVYVDSSGIIQARYRKMHLFSYVNEHKYYTAGITPVVVSVRDFTIGLSICYDLRFPELFRNYAARQVDAIVNIANWPTPRNEAWELFLRARALENLCYVMGVNRTGSDPFTSYSGLSAVIGPWGNTVSCSAEENKIISATLCRDEVIETREKYPFLNDIKLTDFSFPSE